ncbi:MAG TPA: family 43 glycosylhydrolase [Flavihumibacter sp.]|jgi:beta-xylosidase
MKRLLCFVLIITSLSGLKGQSPIQAVIPGDFADPSIISNGHQYFAVGTSSEWAPHFPIYKSSDLVNWKQVGYVFDKAPDWTVGSFWAPEFYFMNGKYYVYYTARRKSDNISCIGVAVSDYPDRGYVDKGVLIDHGKEAIDAYIFEDAGQRYISFKAYGLDKRPIELLATRLSPDGLRTVGEPFTLLKDDERIGIEGQSFLKRGDYYYLFYSGGNCCGRECSYDLRVARSKKFEGPYERYAKNPILSENRDWKCSGHGSFVQDPKGKYFYLYHAYNKKSGVFTGRQGLLAELSWPEGNDWPSFQPPVNNDKNTVQNIEDLFRSAKPALYWQWDWRNSSPVITQQKGELRLGGTVSERNNTGIALTVRPGKQAFDISTRVMDSETMATNAVRGLVYYGDLNAALGLGISGNQVQIWQVKQNQFEVLKSVQLSATGPVELRISVNDAHICRFFFKQSGNWEEIQTDEPVSADYLPQWDRSPRPGLHYKGATDEYARFSYFKLEYK